MAALLRFTPSARTSWHSHAHGQTLHCTEGIGVVVGRDGTELTLRAGETVWTPPGEEHWHGALGGTVRCHLTLVEGDGGGDGATRLEPVGDADYAVAQSAVA